MRGAFKADGYGSVGDYGFESVTVWCTAAVTAGNWIAMQVSNTTNPAALEGFSFVTADLTDVGADYDTIGVAMATTTAAGFVQVQVAGRYASANVATAAAIGTPLCISTVAGRAEEATTQAGSFRILGRVLAEEAGDLATVWLYPHPVLA